jgi:hypothetical protein
MQPEVPALLLCSCIAAPRLLQGTVSITAHRWQGQLLSYMHSAPATSMLLIGKVQVGAS